VTPQPDDESTEFLNVDLEVFSRERLALFVSGLGRSVHVLHEGRWGRRRHAACLELWRSGCGQTPDQIIRGMVRLLKKMPRSAKHLWDAAQTRRFNIGIQAASKPRSFELLLRPATVAAVADVGAQLLITVYAPEPIHPASNETPPNKEMQQTGGARKRPRSARAAVGASS
jgi:hypothetical protein